MQSIVLLSLSTDSQDENRLQLENIAHFLQVLPMHVCWQNRLRFILLCFSFNKLLGVFFV